MSLTQGIDHLGLTTADLDASRAFFEGALGWDVVSADPGYPMVCVSDGSCRLTLWQRRGAGDFDRHENAGLHHVAFGLASRADLDATFAAVRDAPGVTVEFAPELLRDGPVVHCMIREPGGARLEFRHDPR